MAQDPKLVVGDRPMLRFFLKHPQTSAPITDIISAKLRWRIGPQAITESTMVIEAPSGLVWYVFADGQLSIPGTLRCEVRTLDGANRPHTTGEVFTFPVRDSL